VGSSLYGSRMRDELPAIGQFDRLLDAQVLIADCRAEHNTYALLRSRTNGDRPTHHSSRSGLTD
jgi:hypothetical protein